VLTGYLSEVASWGRLSPPQDAREAGLAGRKDCQINGLKGTSFVENEAAQPIGSSCKAEGAGK